MPATRQFNKQALREAIETMGKKEDVHTDLLLHYVANKINIV